MKYLKHFLPVLIIALFSSCEETGALYLFPEERIVKDTFYNVPDSMPEVQEKGILIEDFTGFACSNCPKAAAELHRLVAEFPGRIVPVGIHSKPYNFTNPATKNKSHYDLRSADGEAIYDLLQVDGQLPKGSVDRMKFSFDEHLFYSYLDWKTGVADRLPLTTPCNINVELLSLSEDEVEFQVDVFFTEKVSDPMYITVYILENEVEDYQLNGRNWEEHYLHAHVLRYIATENADGDLLKNIIAKGDFFRRTYTVPIKKGVEGEKFITSWEYNDLSVAAFVSHIGGLDVVHAVEQKLEE